MAFGTQFRLSLNFFALRRGARHAEVPYSPGRKAYTSPGTEQEAGGEARLPIVRSTIRVLLQGKFLSGPRTENSADLGAIDRALV